ncbi:MAG: hypothetical protein ACXWXN_11235 [Actinomycetota bacterium]
MERKYVWRWILAFLAFPPAGFLGRTVAGPIDDPTSALLAGAVAGAVIGAGQWLALRGLGIGWEWIPASAAVRDALDADVAA